MKSTQSLYPFNHKTTLKNLDLKLEIERENNLLNFQFSFLDTVSGTILGLEKNIYSEKMQTTIREHKLWEKTCFELFFWTGEGSHYLETNFSPQGKWQAYTFTGYREGMKDAEILENPLLEWKLNQERRVFNGKLNLSFWPPIMNAKNLRVAASTVILKSNQEIEMWALKHHEGKPDFHYWGGYIIELE